MRTTFERADCQNLKSALSREWLETNGLGSFASSTIIGANTRRQHGLLVAALRPPVERYVLLAKLEESGIVDGRECHISTNLYPGTVFPHGFNIQTEFRLRPWPTFRFSTRECSLDKSLFLVRGENTLVVRYHHVRGDKPLELKVRPLLAFREYNELAHRNDTADMTVTRGPGVLSVQPYRKLLRLYFYTKADGVEVKPDWYYRFTYPVEQERGLEFEEDLFEPFELAFRIPQGRSAYIVVSTERKAVCDPEALTMAEQQRRAEFSRETDPVRQTLQIAADSFIARRGKDHLTVLAGFPWFTDWGRDTLIALPGLTLTTGRFDVALKILQTVAQSCDRGMIPNVFPDAGDSPEYNSIDAPLWFVIAVWRYWKASGDDAGTRQLIPALRDIFKYYREGTRYEIHADTDGLITGGSSATQLTWMDAKVDGYVPTSRHGKAVEINALWLNALLMLAEMAEILERDVAGAVVVRKLADQVTSSFIKTFWYREGGYLYDVVQGDFRDHAVRPNQIFAVALPHTPLGQDQQRAVFDVVTKRLLTPYGLRTLARQHEKYCGKYTGNRLKRDCAYHQGTVWSWLIGPYCDAYARLHGTGKAQRKEMGRLVQGLIDHLEEAGLGQVSEIFDGDPPHRPVGCFAQAWSVAELLRVYDTYLR